MSYTIDELDEAVEEGNFGDDEDGDGWYEFRDAVNSSLEQVFDDTGNPVKKTVTYGSGDRQRSYETNVYRDKGWKGVDIPGIGRATGVDQFGGEGQGDDFWFVFTVTDADGNVRTFRRNGYYSSYDGGSFGDGPTDEVKPVEKTITVWEKI